MAGLKKVEKDSISHIYLEQKPRKGLASHVSNGRRSIGVSASNLIQFIKPRYSFWESKKKNKEPLPLPLPQLKVEESVKNTRKLNLKEWILRSPRTTTVLAASNSSKQSSGRIHPSFEETVGAITPKTLPRDGFCLEGSNNLMSNDDDEEVEPKILPRDGFCLEGSNLISNDDDEEVEPKTLPRVGFYSEGSNLMLNDDDDEEVEPKILPRDGFCLEGSNFMSNNDDEEVEKGANSSVMNQSGKINKRVRFRLPQLVDIIVLDSADGCYFSN